MSVLNSASRSWPQFLALILKSVHLPRCSHYTQRPPFLSASTWRNRSASVLPGSCRKRSAAPGRSRCGRSRKPPGSRCATRTRSIHPRPAPVKAAQRAQPCAGWGLVHRRSQFPPHGSFAPPRAAATGGLGARRGPTRVRVQRLGFGCQPGCGEAPTGICPGRLPPRARPGSSQVCARRVAARRIRPHPG